jgi:CheY-like chemotaxis protein
MSAAEMISDRGFEIIEVENAELAIAVLETRGDVEVVFTDVRMPGSVDGLKLARYVRGKMAADQGHRNVSAF